MPQLDIHLGVGILAAINATIGALILLLIVRLVRGGGRAGGPLGMESALVTERRQVRAEPECSAIRWGSGAIFLPGGRTDCFTAEQGHGRRCGFLYGLERERGPPCSAIPHSQFMVLTHRRAKRFGPIGMSDHTYKCRL